MTDNSPSQAKAQYDNIVDLFKQDTEDATQELVNLPLSILVRSDWVDLITPMKAYEYELLLCTGGPAVRIRGTLNDHKEPVTAILSHQDWGTDWEPYDEVDAGVLLRFAQLFYYGE